MSEVIQPLNSFERKYGIEEKTVDYFLEQLIDNKWVEVAVETGNNAYSSHVDSFSFLHQKVMSPKTVFPSRVVKRTRTEMNEIMFDNSQYVR
jgi:hypothetical protein